MVIRVASAELHLPSALQTLIALDFDLERRSFKQALQITVMFVALYNNGQQVVCIAFVCAVIPCVDNNQLDE